CFFTNNRNREPDLRGATSPFPASSRTVGSRIIFPRPTLLTPLRIAGKTGHLTGDGSRQRPPSSDGPPGKDVRWSWRPAHRQPQKCVPTKEFYDPSNLKDSHFHHSAHDGGE